MMKCLQQKVKLLLQHTEWLVLVLIFLGYLILFLLKPGKSFVRVIQSIGRGIRKAEDKDHVQIWDITSSCKFAKRHLTQRKKFYKEANYPYTIEKIDYENPYIRK